MRHRPKYQDAVDWIARNEETACDDVDVMTNDVCVVLVADVWGKHPRNVAEDVLRTRRRERA